MSASAAAIAPDAIMPVHSGRMSSEVLGRKKTNRWGVSLFADAISQTLVFLCRAGDKTVHFHRARPTTPWLASGRIGKVIVDTIGQIPFHTTASAFNNDKWHKHAKRSHAAGRNTPMLEVLRLVVDTSGELESTRFVAVHRSEQVGGRQVAKPSKAAEVNPSAPIHF